MNAFTDQLNISLIVLGAIWFVISNKTDRVKTALFCALAAAGYLGSMHFEFQSAKIASLLFSISLLAAIYFKLIRTKI
jgi:hypothetical protein